MAPFSGTPTPLLPPDHPHAGQRTHRRAPSSPSKTRDAKNERPKGLEKKALSSMNLRTLATGKEQKEDTRPSKDKQRAKEEESRPQPKKSKSSTSLSSMLVKSKSPKKGEKSDGSSRRPKDKENTTPPSSAVTVTRNPIWAEFTTQSLGDITTKDNNLKPIVDEISKYTPEIYSPSKQRNFYGGYRPTLSKRLASAPRPASTFVTTAIWSDGGNGTKEETKSGADKRFSAFVPPRLSRETSRNALPQISGNRTASSEGRKNTTDQSKTGLGIAKRGARVMAAVAAFNGKAKESDGDSTLDPKAIDAAFEEMLEATNTQEITRQKMRTLTTRVKADLIRQHKAEVANSAPQSPSKKSLRLEDAFKRPTLGHSQKSKDSGIQVNTDEPTGEAKESDSTKRGRPRSKTFTFNKADSSPSKKQKSGGTLSAHSHSKSVEMTKSASSKSLAALGGLQATVLGKAPKSAAPEEFVTYLRKVQKPQAIENNKVHKLRLLLRNETVAWVDTFIQQGGMTEIVGLLHRIMEVEWREEHEDALLHETLLCLKGLCTTDQALAKLQEVESTLFPALLKMLFDEENRGPSEFNTRGTIINLLFTHLAAAPPKELPARARTVLSYLTDPQKPEPDRPHPFVLEMRQPRPYRVWCKEVVNVSKEVFWIFLHHLNVIPLPPSPPSSPEPEPRRADSAQTPSSTLTTSTYATRHFPAPRPPVPAAPYVGGVEWDATNYLSAHLDLLNGLLASLPTPEERNQLRMELHASGFEKVMGASLRTCKEKFYGAVHDGLRTWVAASVEDGWDVTFVRSGPKAGEVRMQDRCGPLGGGGSPKKDRKVPRLDVPVTESPKLSLGLGQKGQEEWL